MSSEIPVWLDADPGHDDAITILLSLHLPNIKLYGISTVHGNGTLTNTTANAIKCLCSFGDPEYTKDIPVYSGAEKPLLRPAKHDTEIHGNDGLGGTEGLLDPTHPLVAGKVANAKSKNAVLAIAETARSLPEGKKLNLVATGTLTNVALFCAMFPELVLSKIEQIVIMGGAEGRGNRSPTAEFNILCDPEAASIVFNAPVKVVLMPLNITHQAIFSQSYYDMLVQASDKSQYWTKASTPLRHTLATILTFFTNTYKTVFGFNDGPPVHDPLTIAYLTHPELFKGKRYRVDIEYKAEFTAGTTVVDLYEYRKNELTAMSDPDSAESWGTYGKNVWVAEDLDVDGFWNLFLDVVEKADKVSPLNKQ